MNEKSDQQLSISKIYHACRIWKAVGSSKIRGGGGGVGGQTIVQGISKDKVLFQFLPKSGAWGAPPGFDGPDLERTAPVVDSSLQIAY